MRRSTRARGSRARSRRCSRCRAEPADRRHPRGQLRAEPPVHARRAPARRRPGRRGRRRARGRDRLPPHRLREDHGAEDVVEGDHVPGADGLPLLPGERARFVLAIEKLLGIEVPPKAVVDADAALRAEPDPLAPRLARHVGARARARSRCSGTASASATRSSTSSSWSAGRACTRATSRPAASPRTSRAASSPSAASSAS